MQLRIKLLSLLLSYFLMISTSVADIKVGTIFFHPPFVLSSDSGFDVQLIKEICKKMNQSCTIIPMNFYNLSSALINGQIDIAIGDITISQQRKENYIFSLPYMLSKGQFIVQRNSDYQSVDDLKGKVVGILKTEGLRSVYYNYLVQNFSDLFSIQEFNDVEDIITALNENKIAAAFLNYLSANYWVMTCSDQLQDLDAASHPLGAGIAIMSVPDKNDLINEINRQLLQMEQDGSYLKIYNTYIPTF